MKVAILAGGLGTRLSEETIVKPKPMVEIGGMPIIWHIMKIYSSYGYNEFVICLGYKGYIIKEFFYNYFLHMSDVTMDIGSNKIKYFNSKSENWKVTLIDTGQETMTGSRLKKIAPYLSEDFMLTYGDGVSDINIKKLVNHHKNSGKLATLTAVQPDGRYGVLDIENNLVNDFVEKPAGDNNWVNAGFFVMNKKILEILDSTRDDEVLETDLLAKLAKDGNLNAYKHSSFWKCMDTIRDKNMLENMWNSDPKWKVWA